MPKQGQYRISVIGSGQSQGKGMLAFVVPQAVDLVTKSAYKVAVTPVFGAPAGSLRLMGEGEGVALAYTPNLNVPRATSTVPTWVWDAEKLINQLGRKTTWQEQI